MNKDEEFREKFMEDLKKGEVDKEGNIYFNSVSGKDKIGKIKTQGFKEIEKEEKNKKSLGFFKEKDVLLKIKKELRKIAQQIKEEVFENGDRNSR